MIGGGQGTWTTLLVCDPRYTKHNIVFHTRCKRRVVFSYKESRNNKPIATYNIMLPNLSPSPNLYEVQSAYILT